MEMITLDLDNILFIDNLIQQVEELCNIETENNSLSFIEMDVIILSLIKEGVIVNVNEVKLDDDFKTFLKINNLKPCTKLGFLVSLNNKSDNVNLGINDLYKEDNLKYQSKTIRYAIITAKNKHKKYIIDGEYNLKLYKSESHNININKGESKMNLNLKGLLGNVEMGMDSNLVLTLNGVGVKKGDSVYVYTNGEITEISEDMIIADGNFGYIIPTGLKEVKEGDLVKFKSQYYYIEEILKDNKLKVMSVDGEEKTIKCSKNMFGMYYVSKITSLFGDKFNKDSTSESNPFGDLLPLLMMGKNEDGNLNNLLPLMMMGNSNFDTNNLLPLLMMNGSNDNNLLPLMLMMKKNEGN